MMKTFFLTKIFNLIAIVFCFGLNYLACNLYYFCYYCYYGYSLFIHYFPFFWFTLELQLF